MSADWHWVNLPGGFTEEVVADLSENFELGRGCIVVQTNATTSFHVGFSHSAALPLRGTDEPVLRFVVGKRRNTMTSVGFGNPYLKKEPVDHTKAPDALLTSDAEKSRTYWFLYDTAVGVAAMGVQVAPQADLCRLVCRFRDSIGFRAEVCERLRYVVLSSGKQPVSLRVVNICAPPDISIPRFRFDPVTWSALPWQGNSFIFELDDEHRRLVERAQRLLMASPIAPFYSCVEPRCLCLNAYRLLDPLRRLELFPGEGAEHLDWAACHGEVHRRLLPVLASAPWTYLPLRFDRADCTGITLAPPGKGCGRAVAEWAKAVQHATGLRNNATNREMLSVAFAFEVFPVEGENAAQARRDLVREIGDLLSKEWGTMEFRVPLLACWQTHTAYVPFDTLQQEPPWQET